MAGQWNIVGTSTATRAERPVSAFRLDGDDSTLIVPLRWPISKDLEEYLPIAGADRIRLYWQVLIAQSEDENVPGYVAFPADDDEMREVWFNSDGSPVDKFPWAGTDDDPAPSNWQALFARWYRSQHWYNKRDLVAAFADAVEAVTGIPLEQSALLLHSWLHDADTGGDVSEPKPASISTKKPTVPKSGRRRTTASPAA